MTTTAIQELPSKITPAFRAEVEHFLNRHMQAGNFAPCHALLDRVIARFPQNASFLRDRARVFHRQRAFWPCAEAWAQFGSLSPSLPEGNPVRYAGAWETKEALLDGVRMTLAPELDAISDVVRFVLVEGRYEQAERKALEFLLAEGDRVLECGAGAGYMGICAQRRVPGVPYVAVEANPALIPVIETNQRLNGVAFEVVRGAVGADQGEIEFVVYDNFMASQAARHASGEGSGEGRRIVAPQLALDGLLRETGANFLIMDIEGAEYESLLSTQLEGVNKLLVELHPAVLGRGRIAELLRHLLALGFEPELDLGSSHVYCMLRA